MPDADKTWVSMTNIVAECRVEEGEFMLNRCSECGTQIIAFIEGDELVYKLFCECDIDPREMELTTVPAKLVEDHHAAAELQGKPIGGDCGYCFKPVDEPNPDCVGSYHPSPEEGPRG